MTDWHALLAKLLSDPAPAMIGGTRVRGRVEVRIYNLPAIRAMAHDRGLL